MVEVRMMARMLKLILLCCLVSSHVVAQPQTAPEEVAPESLPAEPATTDEAVVGPPAELAPEPDPLEPIRALVVELKFEQALAQLELMLDESVSLAPETQFAALELRSATLAALGEFDQALNDYRSLLLLQPSWRPDRTATPKKAMNRFDALKDELVGTVEFQLTPADALVVLDGTALDSIEGPLELLAGEHLIRVERSGHDRFEERLEVVAGEKLAFEVDLIPNARTVIFQTEPAGVAVWVDGALQGVTERDDSFVGIGEPPAELVIEDLPLGEHRFELKKDCYRTESLVEDLHIDLLDRQPQRYETFRMIESFVQLRPSTDLVGAQISIDGAPAEMLPTDALLSCPGERELVVRLADRTVWRERIAVREGPAIELQIEPRPNVAWVGPGEPPSALDQFGEMTNLVALPSDSAVASSDLAWWRSLQLPSEIDLAIAPPTASRQGLEGLAGGWWLYSPLLDRLTQIESLPERRPSWGRPDWGWRLIPAPADEQAVALVLAVTNDGAAAAAGISPRSRLLKIDGDLEGSNPIQVEWSTAEGERKTATLQPRVAPVWFDPAGAATRSTVASDSWRAAWAVVDAATGGEGATDALANLALLVEAYGDLRLAVQSWRRLELPAGEGLSAGTVQYYLGRALQALGQESAAVEALRGAVALGGRAGSGIGPPVAPAARDRLADLGEAP